MTDSEMLDWMIEHEARVWLVGETYRCEWWSNRRDRVCVVFEKAPRAAIQAAMKEGE